MKQLLIIFLLVVSFQLSYSQVLKYKAKYTSLKFNTSKAERIWVPSDILVIIDTAESKVKVYTNPPDSYDIIKFIKSDTKHEDFATLTFKVVDNFGEEATMGISFVHNRDFDALLIIKLFNSKLYFR